MKTLLERTRDVIRFGDVPELEKLFVVMSNRQLVRFACVVGRTSLTTLIDLTADEIARRIDSIPGSAQEMADELLTEINNSK